mmetsp:Transcript_45831/g.97787  ORF Transcript_45831/g.97787 Transcript_45831/m.97787 type:complete len:155 (-) Transcript_45831:72-536(-)|eukprot:CAMPEP_0183351518 /NCGR_PEP_ID=MMETSP0164_2-20130417/25446_1 /TAXON_ID=221442 /ORGANISM="Coccolithus pelagicus ssp braarudi, Strain PLY182g" /LENGTH=154 /DNA_ID=CAMNT_0025523719 /DNA_START=137 /DNA_END=601 /DNA_ORIENTATION=-
MADKTAVEDKAGAGAPPPAEETETKVETPVVEAPLDPQSALKQVLKTSLYHDSLARGLHECVKALDRREAHLCVLSSGCDEKAYTKLIIALCSEHKIPIIRVENSKLLGEWCGLCKYDDEGKARRVVGCSCAVVKSWGEESAARQVLVEHLKSQ